MADGKVLITGGTSKSGWNDPSGLIVIPEVWDPVTETVTQLASASGLYRGYHSTGMLLPDGRILVTGGDHDGGINLNAEIFTPGYLYARTARQRSDPQSRRRPTLSSWATRSLWKRRMRRTSPWPTGLSPVPSRTHRIGPSDRNILDFEVVEGGLNITLPSNENIAPIGYYMLFLVNDQGVPSVAESSAQLLRTFCSTVTSTTTTSSTLRITWSGAMV